MNGSSKASWKTIRAGLVVCAMIGFGSAPLVGAPAPVARWDFESCRGSSTSGAPCLGDSGDVLADRVASHDGAIFGSPAIVSSAIAGGGHAMQFGANKGVRVPSSQDLLPGGHNWTLSVWLKTGPVPSGTSQAIVWPQIGCCGNTSAIALQNAGSQAAGQITWTYHDDRTGGIDPNRVDVASGMRVDDGAWHHLVAVRDKSAGKALLYVDGLQVGSADDSAAVINTASPFAIAHRPAEAIGSAERFFEGSLDELQVFDQALSSQEIVELYQVQQPWSGPDLAIRGITWSPAGTVYANQTNLEIQVEWENSGSGVTSGDYRLELYLNGTKVAQKAYWTSSRGPFSPLMWSGTLPQGDYLVSAKIDAGNQQTEGNESNNQLTAGPIHVLGPDAGPPGVPTPSQPSGGTVIDHGSPQLGWSAVSDPEGNGVKYDVEVATDAGFSNIVRRTTGTIATSWTVQPALGVGLYHWRVRSRDFLDNVSAWSSSLTFEVQSTDVNPPPVPTLLSPADGAQITEGDVVLDWSDVVDPEGSAVTYEVQVSTSSTFGSIERTKAGLVTSLWTVVPGVAAGNYYWRVRGTDGLAQSSSWSSVRSLTAGTPSGNEAPEPTVSTLAGNGPGSADGIGSAAKFRDPHGVAVDSDGNVYVADTSNHTIRKVTAAGEVTTLAGLAGSSGSADGMGSEARFDLPLAVAVDSSGNVYVADQGNHTIRKVSPSGEVATIAGLAGSLGSMDGTGSAARFTSPRGVAVDGSGNVHVADSNNHTIRKITAAGEVTTLAGLAGNSGSADGTGSAARFYKPSGVAVDASGTLYVSDSSNHTIRKITAAGEVTTLAGLARSLGATDGTGSAARFNYPDSVAVDASGILYVADSNNHTIRMITAAGEVTTLAGLAGSAGFEDGTGSAARFWRPRGVAVDRSGTVCVGDTNGAKVRKITTPSFEAHCSAVVVQPVSGTRWQTRSTVIVAWNSKCVFTFDVELWQGSLLYATLAKGIGSTTHEWTIPESVPPGDTYRIRVVNSVGLRLSGFSGFFTITDSVDGAGRLFGFVRSASTGQPVPNASVTCGSSTSPTWTDGRYSLENLTTGAQLCSASAADFATRSTRVEINDESGTRLDFALTPSGIPGSPRLTDLSLGFRKDVYLLQAAPYRQDLRATVDWAGKTPDKVVFSSAPGVDSAVPTTSGEATYYFDPTELPACSTIEAWAVSADGAVSSRVKAPFLTMPKPDIIPIFGSLAMDRDDGIHYRTSVGFDLAALDEGLTDGQIPPDFPLFGDKGIVLRYVPRVSAEITGGGEASLGVDFSNYKLIEGEMAGFSYELTPHLAIVGQFSSCKWNWGGSLGLSGGFTAEQTWPFFVPGPIPMPMYVAASLELAADADLAILDVSPLQLNGSFALHPYARGTIGVGLNDICSAEGWVGVGGEIAFQYPEEPNLQNVTLFANGGVAVDFFFWTWENELLRWDWELYSTAGKSARSLTNLMASEPRLMSRDYLTTRALRKSAPRVLTLRDEDRLPLASHVTASAVELSVFPHPKPDISVAGSYVYGAWLEDDAGRLAINRTKLLFSTFDGSAWGTPIAVSDDGTMDFTPRLTAFSDGRAWVVWEDGASALADTAQFEDTVASMEVSAALYDPTLPGFTGTWRLTDNTTLDRSPRLSGPSADDVVAVWVSNPANAILGTQGEPNTILASWWNGTSWSTPETVATVAYPVMRLEVAYDSTTATIVLEADTDTDTSTIDDHELARLQYSDGAWQTLEWLTFNAVSDLNPRLLRTASSLLLAWLEGDTFKVASDFDLANPVFTSTGTFNSGMADFRFVAGSDGRLAIVWTQASEYSSDVWAIFYDPVADVWGEAQQMTADDATEKELAVGFRNGGNLVGLYARRELGIVSKTRTTPNGKSFLIDVPEYGTADLVTLNAELGEDPAVVPDTLESLPPNPAAGVTATFSVDVTNRGELPVADLVVALYDGDPQTTGSEMARGSMTGTVATGGTATVSVDWTVAETSEPMTLYVVVDPDEVTADRDRTNNGESLVVALPDLVMSAVSWQQLTETLVTVTARVTNNGSIAAPASTVEFRRDSVDGELLQESTLRALGVGESEEIGMTIDVGGWDDGTVVWATVDAAGAVSEASTENNAGSVVLATGCEALPTPVVTAPAGVDTGAAYTVSWNDVAAGVTYELQESTDAAFTTPTTYTETGTSKEFTHTAEVEATYYYRARATSTCRDSATASEWSATVQTAVWPAQTLSIGDATVTEGSSGQTAAQVPVTLSPSASRTVTVNWATVADGTATEGSDFVAASGSLTFSAGETSKNVTVQVVGDTTSEPSETFSVHLSGATNATIADHHATVTITDDDFGAPTGVVATATTTTSVTVTWNAVPGATEYQVYRSAAGTSYALLGPTASTSWVDNTASTDTAYLYAVKAVDSGAATSGYSAPDLATTVIFTDPTLTPGVTKAKTAHVTELRTAVNAVRQLAGIQAANFTDASLSAGTMIKRLHVTELRAALDEARTVLGLAAVSWTDPMIVTGTTVVKAVHVTELRTAVR